MNKVLRRILILLLVAAGLFALYLSSFHAWLSFGPPVADRHIHVYVSGILFSVSFVFLLGSLLLHRILKRRGKSQADTPEAVS